MEVKLLILPKLQILVLWGGAGWFVNQPTNQWNHPTSSSQRRRQNTRSHRRSMTKSTVGIRPVSDMCRFGQKQHRSVPVSVTQEADLEFGAGEWRPDQSRVTVGGEENTKRRPVNRERETDQSKKQRTWSSIGHLRRNKRQPLVDLKPDFQPIIGGSTPAKLRARFLVGFRQFVLWPISLFFRWIFWIPMI